VAGPKNRRLIPEMRSTEPARPVFTLKLRPMPSVDAIRSFALGAEKIAGAARLAMYLDRTGNFQTE
jgi:hypothetical protein